MESLIYNKNHLAVKQLCLIYNVIYTLGWLLYLASASDTFQT